MKIDLPSVTLIIVDCVDLERAKLSFDYCLSVCNFGDAKILSSIHSNDNNVHKIQHLSSTFEYSHFIVEKLSDYFTTDYVLIAQWDGCIWYKELWDNDFFNYDYIGAAWPDYVVNFRFPKNYKVGNGGFSLRSKRLQLFLKNSNKIRWQIDGWPEKHNEDLVICQVNRQMLENEGFKFAPFSVARKFSWEAMSEIPAFGSHNRHVPTRLQNWKNNLSKI